MMYINGNNVDSVCKTCIIQSLNSSLETEKNHPKNLNWTECEGKRKKQTRHIQMNAFGGSCWHKTTDRPHTRFPTWTEDFSSCHRERLCVPGSTPAKGGPPRPHNRVAKSLGQSPNSLGWNCFKGNILGKLPRGRGVERARMGLPGRIDTTLNWTGN